MPIKEPKNNQRKISCNSMLIGNDDHHFFWIFDSDFQQPVEHFSQDVSKTSQALPDPNHHLIFPLHTAPKFPGLADSIIIHQLTPDRNLAFSSFWPHHPIIRQDLPSLAPWNVVSHHYLASQDSEAAANHCSSELLPRHSYWSPNL